MRRSWREGLKARQQLGETVSGSLLEEAGEEPGAAGGGARESTEDEKGVPHRPEGGRGICENLVLEGGQQVEEETVQLQDGLGSLEGARAEAVGGKAELELPDAVVAVGAHGPHPHENGKTMEGLIEKGRDPSCRARVAAAQPGVKDPPAPHQHRQDRVMRGAPVPAGVVLLQASFLLPMALSVRKAPASHQNGHQQRDGHIDARHLIRRRPPVR